MSTSSTDTSTQPSHPAQEKHTPGPWRVEKVHLGGPDYYFEIHGNLVPVGDASEIAQTIVRDTEIEQPLLERDEANAQLIVTAVNSHAQLQQQRDELAEALRRAYKNMAGNNDPFDPAEWAGAVKQAAAALEKAGKGEKQS